MPRSRCGQTSLDTVQGEAGNQEGPACSGQGHKKVAARLCAADGAPGQPGPRQSACPSPRSDAADEPVGARTKDAAQGLQQASQRQTLAEPQLSAALEKAELPLERLTGGPQRPTISPSPELPASQYKSHNCFCSVAAVSGVLMIESTCKRGLLTPSIYMEPGMRIT